MYGLAAPAGDRIVVRNTDDMLAAAVSQITELNLLTQITPTDHPRITEAKPVVGTFDLIPVTHFLFEDSVLVPEGVTDRGNRHGGHRIEEAGRQSSETAVAKARIVLVALQGLQRNPVLLERRTNPWFELKIKNVVPHRSAK